MSSGGVKITWLGHAAIKMETVSGKVILIDPWLQNNPSTQHTAQSIGQVDLMLITHGHFDHFEDALQVAQQTNCDVIAIFEVASYLQSKGVKNVTGMNIGGTTTWNSIQITMTEAIHSSGIMEGNTIMSGGHATGFVIRFEDDFTVYVAGDTDVFSSMALIGELHQPDLAILPIGDFYTMGPKGAAAALRLLGVERVIPIHWGTFPLLTGTPEQLEKEASDISGLRVFALQPGQSVAQTEIV